MEADQTKHEKIKLSQIIDKIIDDMSKRFSELVQLTSANHHLMWIITDIFNNAKQMLEEYKEVSSDIDEAIKIQPEEAIHVIYGRLLNLRSYKLFSIFTALSRRLDPNPLLSKPLPVTEVKVEMSDDEFGKVREVTNAFYTWTPLKPRLFDNGIYFTILPLQNMKILSWSKNSIGLATTIEKSVKYPECERLPSHGDENVCRFERLPYLCIYVGKNAKNMCESNKWCLGYVYPSGKKYERYAVYACFKNYEGQHLHFIMGGDVIAAEGGARDIATSYCQLGYFISSSYYLNLQAFRNRRCPLEELAQLSRKLDSMPNIDLPRICRKCASRKYRYLSSEESLLRLVKIVPRTSTSIQFHEVSDVVKLYNNELIAIFSEKGQLCEKTDSVVLVLNPSKFLYVDVNEYEANLQVKPGYCVETKTLALLWSEEYLRKTINKILSERPYTRKWLAYKLALQLLMSKSRGYKVLGDRENFLKIITKYFEKLKYFIDYFENLLKSGLEALDKKEVAKEIPCLIKFIKTKYGGKFVGLLKMEVKASDYIIWSLMEALSQVIVNVYAALISADPENFAAVPIEFHTVNGKHYYGVALAERSGGGLGYLEAFWRELKHDKEHAYKLLLNTVITLMLEETQFIEYLVKELGKVDSVTKYEHKILERIEKVTRIARIGQTDQHQKSIEIFRKTAKWITLLSKETGLYPPIPIWIAQLYLANLTLEDDKIQELIKELAYVLFQLLHHCWDGCPNCIAQDKANIDNLICRSKHLLADLIAYTLKDINALLSDVDYELVLILGPLLLLAQKKLAVIAPYISRPIKDMLTTLKLFRPELEIEIKETKEHVKAYIVDDLLVVTGSVNPTVKGLHENVESITILFGKKALKIKEKLRKLIT